MTQSWKNEPQYIELKNDFINSLPERIEALKTILSRITAGEDLTDCARQYHFIVHKLAGISRSFDLVQLANLSEKEDEEWGTTLDSSVGIAKKDLVESIHQTLVMLQAQADSF